MVNARVAVIGALEFEVGAGVSPVAREDAVAPAGARRRIYLGDWIDVPVHRLDALTPGEAFKGPALFESPTTTVLVRESEHVRVTPHGWLDIRLP